MVFEQSKSSTPFVTPRGFPLCFEDFEALMARGHTGDTSVLPAILQLLSSGGGQVAAKKAFTKGYHNLPESVRKHIVSLYLGSM